MGVLPKQADQPGAYQGAQKEVIRDAWLITVNLEVMERGGKQGDLCISKVAPSGATDKAMHHGQNRQAALRSTP